MPDNPTPESDTPQDPKHADATERYEVKGSGSTWFAAHMAITIPLLIFIIALIYVLMQWPSTKKKDNNSDSNLPTTQEVREKNPLR